MIIKKFFIRLFLVSALVLSVSPSGLFAQDETVEQAPSAEKVETEKEKSKVKEVIRPGVLSSSGKFAGSESIDTGSSVTAAGDSDITPIVGSVSRTKKGRCAARIYNNSEQNRYSVNFDIVGLDSRGNQVLRRTYSASLTPKGSVTKELSCRDDLNMEVVLRSGRQLNK